jgi:4'-phosphopantetheinyl transferase
MLVSDYTGIAPAALHFLYGPHGKPSLDHEGDLRFNVSHTAGLALIAFTQGTEVGVDVEWAGRAVDFMGIAESYFSPLEYADLKSRDSAAFLEYWTCKEAYIKARGGGLSIPLNAFTVARSGGLSGWRNIMGADGILLPCIVRLLDAGPEYSAAVAVPPGEWQVRMFADADLTSKLG